MLALHGFDTWGLEVSQEAVDFASNNVKAQIASPSAGYFGTKPSRIAAGNAEIILGDFFTQDWEAQLNKDFTGFDLIYDYTVRS